MRIKTGGAASHRRDRAVSRLALACGVSAGLGAMTGLAAHFARLVLTPSAKPDDRAQVLRIEEAPAGSGSERVWLEGPEVDLEGSYSFIFDAESRLTQEHAGHARLGPVVESHRVRGRLQVVREVIEVLQGDLRPGAQGRITGWWFSAPDQLGYRVQRIALPIPGGVSWGWVVYPREPEADTGRWAVHVHGRGAMPHETLRGVTPFAEAGITSLVIAYRNDPGAPEGLRGRYGLGIMESEDVEAAIGFVRSKGARRVTLVGWSMGATACVIAAAGRHRGVVDGLVLDSPALDWPDILRAQARLARLPRAVGELAMILLRIGTVRGSSDRRRGTDLSAISVRRLAQLVNVPVLIHAGPGDTFVPWGGALRLARLRSRFVRLRPAKGEHVKHWNVDAASWESETSKFIESLSSPVAQ